jgi:hypothetical protein
MEEDEFLEFCSEFNRKIDNKAVTQQEVEELVRMIQERKYINEILLDILGNTKRSEYESLIASFLDSKNQFEAERSLTILTQRWKLYPKYFDRLLGSIKNEDKKFSYLRSRAAFLLGLYIHKSKEYHLGRILLNIYNSSDEIKKDFESALFVIVMPYSKYEEIKSSENFDPMPYLKQIEDLIIESEKNKSS